jgi:spoIIIJ-associated protein
VSGIEWVEVRAPSIEEAMAVALAELGLSEDAAEIEIIERPARGFLGMGGQDAVIRVKAKQVGREAGRGRSGRKGEGTTPRPGSKSKSGRGSEPRSKARAASGGGDGSEPTPQARRGGRPKADRPVAAKSTKSDDDRLDMSPEEQAADIERFLSGLLRALGLEGTVETRVEDGVIYAEVIGVQTEALVGSKGSTLQSTLELCRTIIQRRAQGGAKIRLDIAGYNERRREALRIYSRRLADKVLEEGGEVMLEPMNSAERKVVHDTIAEIEGVRSYSEGEEPRRSVIVARESAAE